MCGLLSILLAAIGSVIAKELANRRKASRDLMVVFLLKASAFVARVIHPNNPDSRSVELGKQSSGL